MFQSISKTLKKLLGDKRGSHDITAPSHKLTVAGSCVLAVTGLTYYCAGQKTQIDGMNSTGDSTMAAVSAPGGGTVGTTDKSKVAYKAP